MTTTDPIRSIEARTVTLPLPAVLRLGSMLISERHYAVVRITTDDGLVGHAYGQSRGAPVAEIVDRLLAPVLLGADAAAIGDRWSDCYRSTIAVGRVGLVIRAISLIDIALWDIAGQRAGVPLGVALGGSQTDVEVIQVVGYPSDVDGLDAIVEVATAAADRGHKTVKIARSLDPDVTRALLERFDATLPADTRFIVDGNWVWTDPADALRESAQWPSERFAWFEDPFAPELIDAYRELRASSGVPIGVGEEVTDPIVHRSLVAADAVDVLRVDVTTIGGFTKAAEIATLATEAGLPLSCHVYPEISVHAAAAWTACNTIETFDRAGNPYDPSHTLVEGGPEFLGGRAKVSSAPGIGFTIDPDRFR